MSDSLAGQFLIASKYLRDPNFYQSVVLIIRHGSDGALGLVVNRPSNNTEAAKIQQRLKLPRPEQPLYCGGPVEPTALFLLRDGEEDDAVWSVVEGLMVGTSPQAFLTVAELAQSGREVNYRVIAGCAGWGPGQLEGELFRNDWHLQPATADEVLKYDPYALWQDLRNRAQAESRLFNKLTGDPGLN